MKKRVHVLVGGAATDLNDGSRFVWLDDDGTGMTPFHRLEERGPTQHGATDVGYQLDPRLIQGVLGFYGNGDIDYWNGREEILRLFRPRQSPLGLRFDLPNGKVRQWDVHLTNAFTLPSTDRQRTFHKIGLSLKADDPTCYDPEPRAVVFAVGGSGSGSPGLRYPFRYPIRYGSSTISATQPIVYAGDVRTYPTIELIGPLTDPVLTNRSTGDVLSFSGTTIAAGATLHIDCRPGIKTITLVDTAGVATNGIHLQDISVSTLATFHIGADDELESNVNELRITATGATEASLIILRYLDRFSGF